MKTSNVGMRHHIALIEGWLEPGTAGTKAGTIVVPGMRNDSGTDIDVGDVVVLLGDGTIELADVAQDTRPVGVAIDDIADGETGPVQWFGPVSQVHTTGSVTAGNYAETTATAGQATQSAIRRVGSFGRFTSSGTDPSAFLFGISDSAGSGTGGAETPIDHGSMGATETIDVSAGTWHRGTLNANCAITVQGFTVDEGVIAVFECAQDGTGGWAITWDSDVSFIGDDQPDETAATVTVFVLFSSAGDSTIYGVRVGGSVASNLRWEAVTDGEDVFVWEGDDLVHEWKEY